MTEDEAKTKWCPFARNVAGVVSADGTSQHVAQQGSYNRIIDGASGNGAFPKSGCCLGSACTVWRRQRFWWPAWTVGEVGYRKTAGYCGLAGRP